MAKHPLSAQKIQEIRDLAMQWGRIVARRAFGDAGVGLETDFSTLEQIAQAAACTAGDSHRRSREVLYYAPHEGIV